MSWRPAGREPPAEKETTGCSDVWTHIATIASLLIHHQDLVLRQLQEHRTTQESFDRTLAIGGTQQDTRHTADAPETTDTAPEPPRTPEQPTVAVSRVTPPKDTTRELLDTRIVPRALWAADEGLRQEHALQIVAMHDAVCVLRALSKVEAQRTMASTLLGWKHRLSDHQAQQQTISEGLRQEHTVYFDTDAAAGTQGVHATPNAQSEEYSGGKMTVAAGPTQQQNKGRQQQPQQQTRQQGRQQDHVRNAADMQQQQQRWMQRRHPQINAHDQQAGQKTPQLFPDRQLLSFLDEAEVASTTMRPFYKDYDEVYLEQMWATLQVAEAEYKTTNPRLIRGILQKKHNRITTLEANSPRAGDDWAD